MFKNKKRKTLVQNIKTKAQHNFPIRVLYKKTNMIPEVKIIPSVKKLKKAIIKRNLDIIPYENVFIICFNQKLTNITIPNIILPLKSIYGDLIIVRIDRKEREFKGLSQKDIIWYSQDLINKTPPNAITNLNTRPSVKKFKEYYERNFEKDSNNSFNFEKELINELENIEIVLATILKNGYMKNE